jgi:DNA-binding LacI/PurR family transcriptional regulator
MADSTTVQFRQTIDEVMGEMAVKMLLDRLDDPQHLPYKIVLPPTLAVRDSVVDIPDEI